MCYGFDVGLVVINDVVCLDLCMLFGGIKELGYGCEFVSYGICEFVNVKSVVGV